MSLQDTGFLWCFYEGLLEGENCPKPAVTQRRVLEEDQLRARLLHVESPSGSKRECSSLDL